MKIWFSHFFANVFRVPATSCDISTESYEKSAIPAMLRLLNKEDLKMKEALNTSVTRESCYYNSISVKI